MSTTAFSVSTPASTPSPTFAPRGVLATALIGFGLGLACAAPAWAHPHASADDDDSQVRRAHGVHIHGKSTLNLALEDDRLLIELDSPTMNLFGFEHPPRTDAQRAAVEDARALLGDGAKLFRINPEAGCDLTSAQVRLTLEEPKHDHDHDHDHDDHHADAHVDYSFECADPERLTHVDVIFFDVFPMTERLRAQVIGTTDQTGLMLTPDKIRIDL